MRQRSSQSGIATLEIVLVAVIVMLAAGLILFVKHSANDTIDTLDKASSAASNTPARVVKPHPSVETVKAVYEDYLQKLNDGASRQQALVAVKASFAPDVYAALVSSKATYDPLTCLNTPPTKYAVTLSENNDGIQSVRFLQTDAKNGAAYLTVNSASKLITAVKCGL